MTQAVRSLLSRPLESLLLLITIAFGVALCSVVLSAAWPGLGRAGALGSPGLGSHEITVQPRSEDYSQFFGSGAPPVARVGRTGQAQVAVDFTDLAKLKASAPAVQFAYVNDFFALGDLRKAQTVQMVSPGYLDALGATLVQGTSFSNADYRDRTPGVLLTEYAAQYLFPGEVAVGQLVGGFKVLGVIKIPEDDKDLFRLAGQDAAGSGALGVVPYGVASQETSTMQLMVPPLSTLRFLPFPGQDAAAAQQLGAAVEKRWGYRVSVNSNVERRVAEAKLARRSAASLAILGLCGLLVASLSVLSLMLSRVLSRQRQLGMAAALGASRTRLRSQFLAEVALLGTLGSVLGGLIALGLLNWLNRGSAAAPAAFYGGVLPIVPAVLMGTVAGGILLSVLFGLAPAFQASRVRPAEALRG